MNSTTKSIFNIFMNNAQTAVNSIQVPLMRTVESRFQNGQQLRLKKKEKEKGKRANKKTQMCKRGSRRTMQTWIQTWIQIC